MKKWCVFGVYTLCAVLLVLAAPAIGTGVAVDTWKALLFDVSQADADKYAGVNHQMVATVMPARVILPEVLPEDLYVIDATEKSASITKAFQIARRSPKSVTYTMVYSADREIPITLLIEGETETILVRIENVSFAIEEDMNNRVAMVH